MDLGLDLDLRANSENSVEQQLAVLAGIVKSIAEQRLSARQVAEPARPDDDTILGRLSLLLEQLKNEDQDVPLKTYWHVRAVLKGLFVSNCFLFLMSVATGSKIWYQLGYLTESLNFTAAIADYLLTLDSSAGGMAAVRFWAPAQFVITSLWAASIARAGVLFSIYQAYFGLGATQDALLFWIVFTPFTCIVQTWTLYKGRNLLRVRFRGQLTVQATMIFQRFTHIFGIQFLLTIVAIIDVGRYGEAAMASSVVTGAVTISLPWVYVLSLLVYQTAGVSLRGMMTMGLDRLQTFAVIVLGLYASTAGVAYLVLEVNQEIEETDLGTAALVKDVLYYIYAISFASAVLIVRRVGNALEDTDLSAKASDVELGPGASPFHDEDTQGQVPGTAIEPNNKPRILNLEF